MIDLKSNIQIKIGSEKNFGITIGTVFLIIFLIYFYINLKINFYLIFMSLIFYILGIFFPLLLKIPNRIWVNFGIFLGKLISPFVMSLIFFLVVTPIGLLMRLFKKNTTSINIKNNKSHWVIRNKKPGDMSNQF
ncbi:SxtJ family membrane protein [Alphaproteobacteria bacterium]|nr:SxtJ family membrane protein [Alphaproteobacteria bacterium]